MIVIKSPHSIEAKIRDEQEKRRQSRRQEDILKGLTRSSEPQRGDFKEARRYDKIMSDYRKFKDPKDREKIKKEYFGIQYERRGIRG